MKKDEVARLERLKDEAALDYFEAFKRLRELDQAAVIQKCSVDAALLRFESATINYFKAKLGK